MSAEDVRKPGAGWLRRHAGKGVLLLAVLALLAWAAPRWVQGPQVPVETVVRRDFVQTVVASGRVETPHRVNVGVQITGTVQRIPVAEGQAVAAGAVLLELESSELRAGLRQARANHEAARQALARNRDLLAQGFIGQAALDETLRAEQVAAAQVRSAEQQLASARAGGSETAVAEAALAAASAGADVARAKLRYATVTAPVAGTLITRNAEPGDVVQPGKVLMVLSPAPASGETQLVLQIDEKNLRLLRVGQPALASADAYAQQRFPAEVASISPGVDAQRGAVEVKLRVAAPPDYLKQDMTVSVDIEVARRAAALLVPADALMAPDSATPWVMKVAGGHARRQAVTLGLRSDGFAEVLSGLNEGDAAVAAPAAATLADGARIRPVPRVARE